MQIKEVSKRTDLSIKTIRFYEERGLITPQKEYRNGRYFRNYREEDIAQLQMVAVLRKCLFSIEQIKTMLEHPELTADIFAEYREELLGKSDYLLCLAEKARTVDMAELHDPETLARQMAKTAEPLPLPKMDIRPRFRYLDELEEAPPHVEMQTNFSESGDCSEALNEVLAYRLMGNNGKRVVNGVFDMMHEHPETVVPDHIDRDGKAMRIWKRMFEIGMAIGIFQMLREWIAVPVPQKSPIWPWLVLFLVSGVIRGVLTFVTWHKERSVWGMLP